MRAQRPHTLSARTTRDSAWVATVVAVAAVSGCVRGPSGEKSVLAQVIRTEGKVTVEREHKETSATPQSSLFSGDIVATSTASKALLRYRDGRELSVFEKTRFRLDDSPGKLMLTLEEGTVLALGRTGTGDGRKRLSVMTPAGEVEVVQGTELQFFVGGQRATMSVVFGETAVVGPDGQTLTVVAGEQIDLVLKKVEKTAPNERKPLDFNLRAQRGQPTFREPSQQSFSPLTSSPKTVPTKTAFRLPEGTEASLATQGMQLQLSRRATGETGEAASDARGHHYGVHLEAGEAQLTFQGEGQKTLSLGTAAGGVGLEAQGPAAARVEVSPKGTFVDVQVGQLTLTRNGKRQVVNAGQRGTVFEEQLQVAETPTAAWVLPLSQNVRVYSEELREVLLALPAGAKERHVEIARDAEFQDVVLSGPTEKPHVLIRPPARGTLYWRVSTEGVPAQTGQAVFDQDNGRSTMRKDSPHAEVAESGLKATVFFQSAPPAITLRFSPHADAEKYRVQVFRAQELGTPLVERVVTRPTCTLKAGVLREGQFVWFAQGIDARGVELPGGRMNKLNLVYDNARRTLAILKPAPRARPRTPMIETEGVAPLGSKLYVNNTYAPLDGKGRFGLRVPRADVLVFRLVSQAGDESYWVRYFGE
jgi:hypothetical protein